MTIDQGRKEGRSNRPADSRSHQEQTAAGVKEAMETCRLRLLRDRRNKLHKEERHVYCSHPRREIYATTNMVKRIGNDSE